MLKIENLTKTYKRGRHEVRALKDVSFTLPDNGFVFITGKSGCGKSTMLNLIGGLDNITSGDIVCDGNRISEFSIKDFDNYRNNYLGFVFQDFHLIEDLNVFENVAMSLNLLGIKISKDEEEKMVTEALKGVELGEEYWHRFVRELSGGQKQRVAIARALVKDPHLILADEPTGNLDSKTSKIILELLKKLSEDRLVVIVSHNLDDAKKYGDRIIELADGEIISDVEKVPNYTNRPTLIDGTLTLPYCQPLSSEQLAVINTSLSENNIKNIKQNTSGFTPTKPHAPSSRKIDITSGHLRFRKALGLAGFFSRKHWFGCATTIIVTALLVLVLGICQFFIQFETSSAISIAMADSNEELIIAHKGYLDEDGELNDNYMIEISNTELELFRDSEYGADIYPIYNNAITMTSFYADASNIIKPFRNFNDIYLKETYGTLGCDVEYLTQQFGINGDLEFLAGELDTYPYGVVITDYVADCIIYQKEDYQDMSYEDLVQYKNICDRVVVNGIIKTDYKTKYAELFKYFNDITIGIDRSADQENMKQVVKDFTQDVWKRYGLSYTVYPNFQSACSDLSASRVTNIEKARFILENGGQRTSSPLYLYHDETLNPGEVRMQYDFFNTYFGAVYGKYDEDNYHEFEPITFTIEEYSPHDESTIIQKEVKIAYLTPATKISYDYIYASQDVVETFKSIETTPYALLFTSNQNIDKLFQLFEDNNYSVMSTTYSSIYSIGKIVNIFERFFSLILIGLLAICTLLIISNSYRNIKKRFYEIGVLKALGAKTRDVGFIFSMQTIVTGIIVCTLSTLALILTCNPINNTLITSLAEFLNNPNLGAIDIIQFYPLTMLVNIAFILIATLISCVVPLFKLHHIKPNIIMQKEKH
jgi:ABC-type lipoprotein export system ATPase subunit/ABC-type antimicrobial peptide transport system permease subunit